MIWGILGALPEEVSLIRANMTDVHAEERLGTAFYTGSISGHSVVLVCCGIGKVNAAICATTVLQAYHADVVINVGIAGAMHHGLKVMDIVIGREAGFHDQDPIMLKYYPQKQFFPCDSTLMTLCKKACEQLSLSERVKVGRILSGDVFVSDQQTKDSINSRFTPACVEMEGASIGHTCYIHEKPFLIIRTMSDTADDDAAQSYDNLIERAAEQSAHIVLKMLELAPQK